MRFHIDEAIEALPKEEDEVRSALPADLEATIENVRERWKARGRRADGVGLGVSSLALAAKLPRTAGQGRPDDAELEAWDAAFKIENPRACGPDSCLDEIRKAGRMTVCPRTIPNLNPDADCDR
jgi:hypothetical protein